jgi:isopenicillin N synthase-like dioxygenase
LASRMWMSRLAATLVAAPVIAAAVFLIWQSRDRAAPPGSDAALFFDHYTSGRYEQALAEAQKTNITDYRAHVYLAATYAQLDRDAEARSTIAEMHAKWPDLPDDLRQDLIDHHGLAPDVTDHLLAALSKSDP